MVPPHRNCPEPTYPPPGYGKGNTSELKRAMNGYAHTIPAQVRFKFWWGLLAGIWIGGGAVTIANVLTR